MFEDESAIRRVNGEGLLLIGGGRALLMQLAHPLVARGVAEHSAFAQDPFGRLLRTLRPIYAIAFGDETQAIDAGRAVRRRHATVRGPGYRASDPALMLWVLATLVDTAFVVHSRFLGPLSQSERERYYFDCLRMGSVFGLDPRHAPPSIAAFERYVEEQVATLEVTPEARAMARDVLRARPWWWVPSALTARYLTAGLLPPRLREAYGLGWGPQRQRALEAAALASRATTPRLPRSWRRPPWFLMPPAAEPAPSGSGGGA